MKVAIQIKYYYYYYYKCKRYCEKKVFYHALEEV